MCVCVCAGIDISNLRTLEKVSETWFIHYIVPSLTVTLGLFNKTQPKWLHPQFNGRKSAVISELDREP